MTIPFLKNNKKTAPLSRVIPYAGFEGDLMILQDGRVVMGFEVMSEETEKRDAGGIEAMHEAFSQALKTLPVGSVIHKLDCYYHLPFQGNKHESGYFQRKHQSHLYHRLVLKHKSYLFLSIGREDQPKATPVNNPFSLGSKSFMKNLLAGIDTRIAQTLRLGSEFTASLSALGIPCKQLDKAALCGLYFQYFNMEFADTPTAYNRQILNHQTGLSLGEKHVRILSLKGQGNTAEHSMAHNGVAQPFVAPLTHFLDFPHILSTTIRIEDQSKELKRLDRDKKLSNALGTFSNQNFQIKAQEIDLFTAEVRVDNKQLVSLSMCLLLWDSDLEVVEQRINQGISAFRQMNGAECLVENLATANLFVANAPGNAFYNTGWLLMPSEQASAYVHFSTNYRSDQDGVNVCDRLRNPLLVRLFNTDLNNQNSIVVGPSGSGKSFTIGSWIIQRHEQGHRQIIIDNGGTYLNAVAGLGGKYFEYDPANPLRFNPFFAEKHEGSYVLQGEKLTFLVALLATMWKGNSGGQLSQAERAVLVKLIPSYYRAATELPTFKGFYEWFKAYDEERQGDKEHQQLREHFDVNEFLLVMEPFVYGEYREMLNSEEDIDISAYPLIAFDMAKVKSNMLLYPIVALLITELTLDQIRRFPNQRKYVYMDEAWSMLSDTMGEFVEHMYRTVRKNNGSISIITQGVSEIVESAVGNAILANAATQIILNHTDKKQIARLGEVFGFTRHELDKITSIQVSKDYREIFVKQGDYAKVYILEVSPHMAAILSSKPHERNHLSRLIEQKREISHALDQHVEDIKEGVIHG